MQQPATEVKPFHSPLQEKREKKCYFQHTVIDHPKQHGIFPCSFLIHEPHGCVKGEVQGVRANVTRKK